MVPPDQRFITYDPPVLYAQFRLVIEYQLLRIDGFPKSCLDFEARNGPLAHAFVEHGKTRLAAGLGVIHGGVRVAQQVFRRVSRGTQRDPYTDGGKHLASIQLKRGVEFVEYALRDHCGVGLVPHVTEENRELVAAEAGNDGLPGFPSSADTRPQPPGNSHQQLIAGRVTQAVVDELETV